jgi:flagellar motor protein MotB
MPLRFEMAINEAPVAIEGKIRPFHLQPQGEFAVRVDNFQLAALLPLINKSGVSKLEGAFQTDSQIAAQYDLVRREVKADFEGALALSNLRVETLKGGIEEGSLAWTGAASLRGPAQTPTVEAEGNISTTNLRGTYADEPELRVAAATTTALDVVLRLNMGEERIEAEWTGSTSINDVSLSSSSVNVAHASIAWNGRGAAAGAMSQPDVEVEGFLALDALDAQLQEPSYHVVQDHAEWDGRFDAAGGQIELTGSLSGTAIQVADAERGRLLARLQSYAVKVLQVVGADFSAEQVSLADLRALERALPEDAPEDAPRHLVSVAAVEVTALQASSNASTCDTLSISGLDVLLERNEDGSLTLNEWFAQGETIEALVEPEETDKTPAPPAAEGPAYRTQIGRFTLGEDSRIRLRDETVSPAVRLTLFPVEVTMERIDTANMNQPSAFSVMAKLDEYSSIDFEGSAALRGEDPTADVSGALEAVDLSVFAPYTGRFTGYRVNSGLLDATTEVKLLEGNLDSTTELHFNKLEMEKLDPDEQDAFTQELGVPLNAALSLLRDKNDDIHLTLPVQGHILDPEIDASDAINQAIAGALVKSVKGSVTAVFAPVRAVAKFGGAAVGLNTMLSFESLAFDPGAADLSPDAREYLDGLAEILDSRPKIRLSLCGFAEAGDGLALGLPVPMTADEALNDESKEALLDLATARANAAKAYLVDNHGLEADRLHLCSPRVDEEPESNPRVEITL